jgi:excisionase family DNA binding protein
MRVGIVSDTGLLGSPKLERETGLGPATLGLGTREKTSQGVAGDSKRSQIRQVAEDGPSRASPRIAPNSQPFGALVVQASPEAGGSGSGLIGPYLTAREVAARLRVCTATVYRLCDAGELMHVRVSNAVRVGEGDLRAFLQRGRR